MIILMVTLGIIGYVAGWFSEAGEVAQDEFGPRAAVRKYEWFKNKSNSLNAAEKVIKITEGAIEDFKESAGPRGNWTFEDKEEYSRLTTDLRGQKAFFENLKAEYRAACKKANWEIFKDDDEVVKWADEVTSGEITNR